MLGARQQGVAGDGVGVRRRSSSALPMSELLGPSRASIGVVLVRRGHFCPDTDASAMQSAELKQALRFITKVLTDPRIGPGQGDLLRSARRELLAVARSGKLERERVFRAVEIIATVLLELVEDDATQ